MRKQLSIYVTLAIVLQFLFASFVDYFGWTMIMVYKGMGIKLTSTTIFCILIGHWAFIWPVAVAVVVIFLWRANSSDSTLVHFVFTIMSVSFIMLMVFVFFSILPLTQLMWMHS